MRMLTKLFVTAILLLALSAPAFADELPAPLEKDIFPGVSHVNYAGQNFTFNTPVPLHVSFVTKGFTIIELKFKVYPSAGSRGGASQASPDDQIAIYWNEWSVNVYAGPPPLEEWEGLLHTESGFTEK
jgi:hypothetical protein